MKDNKLFVLTFVLQEVDKNAYNKLTAIIKNFFLSNDIHIKNIKVLKINKAVDFFVIVESTTDHQGKDKKLNFNINKYKKFEKKIIYVVVDDTNKEIKKPHVGQNSMVEQYQRNSITKGLKDSSDDDLIIISDVDEIPDLSKLKYMDQKKRFSVFVQKKYDYKLNLQNITEGDWYGSKICKKKDLVSPQWLRNLKFKKYPFWRVDKVRDIKIIKNASIARRYFEKNFFFFSW